MNDALAWEIRLERPDDGPQIEALVDLAFGPGRFAKTTYRLREGVEPDGRLGFVAEARAGALLGSVRFWPIMVGGKLSLLLGPLAVHTASRGRGIGVALMTHGIEAARAAHYETVLLVGDETYYARVGFARLPPSRIRLPGPVDAARILGLSLVPGALLALSGAATRARIDVPVSAQATAFAS